MKAEAYNDKMLKINGTFSMTYFAHTMFIWKALLYLRMYPVGDHNTSRHNVLRRHVMLPFGEKKPAYIGISRYR